MKTRERKFSVAKLVQAFNAGQLLRNPEYQRGEAWREYQKAAFIDSIFRDYPVPALFLFVVETVGLEDRPAKKFEIVDGQQRLIALRDFKESKIQLLEMNDDSKLRLPRSVRQKPAPWAGKYYTELSNELKHQFEEFELTIFEIGSDALPDEVRDLFIRLQSGTALTRQQIRDAWPGNLGPYIESLAGKLDRHPAEKLFAIVDRRGARAEEDDRDKYVTDRQLAAQLLKIFLAHERDSAVFASVSANELDNLYHAETDWEATGPSANKFRFILDLTARVFEALEKCRPGTKKFARLDVTVVMLYLQDLTRAANAKVDRNFVEAVARTFATAPVQDKPMGGKSSSPVRLKKFYEWWRSHSPDKELVRLDPRRAFDDSQKKEIWQKADGKCKICSETISDADLEYDHFPIPHRDGGPTEVSNGRLVHASCHPRGRPLEDD